jgi:hypothetical protein
LRPTAGLVPTVLLPLDFPRIPGEETLLLQWSAISRVSLVEGARDSETGGTGLTRQPTANDVDDYIKLVSLV